MKILLVDDDAFLRDMYATKFTELQHTIDVASTAEGALTKLRSEQYDVILMDVVMPGMTGIELLKEIQEKKLGGKPVCIMLTNQGEGQEKKESLELGASGYIVKAEFIPSEVVQEVIKLVSK